MSIITIKWCTCTEAAAPPIIHSAHLSKEMYHQNKSSVKDFSNIKSELDLKTHYLTKSMWTRQISCSLWSEMFPGFHSSEDES